MVRIAGSGWPSRPSHISTPYCANKAAETASRFAAKATARVQRAESKAAKAKLAAAKKAALKKDGPRIVTPNRRATAAARATARRRSAPPRPRPRPAPAAAPVHDSDLEMVDVESSDEADDFLMDKSDLT